MSKAFLISTIVFAALTLNALRPLPEVVSFFLSWLTMELAPHHLVANLILLGFFASAGAIKGTAGTVGLVLEAVTIAGLGWMIVSAHRVLGIMERALAEGLGPDYQEKILPHRAANHDLRVPWRQLILPFRMRHADVERVRNLSYGPHGRRNRLDVYRHKDHPTGAPILLHVHGGAWITSGANKDRTGIPMMLHFASRGWVCFSPNYRLSPKSTWPDQIVDVKKAIAWIREHASEHGGDPNFILVTGGSAGGHLSALAALTPNLPEFQPGFEDADTSLQCAIPGYGIYDWAGGTGMNQWGMRRMLERQVVKRSFKTDREIYERASPIAHVSADAPPFFAVHGAHDSLVPVRGARRFVKRLREVSKAPVVYAELPGAQHAFDTFPSIRTAHVIRAVERFADYAYSEWLRKREGLPEPEPEPERAART